ncbi:cell wall-binding repeat-containing protein [Bacillus marinisedimentorum]|uniref:cell wall-binding repeat-containing protein n=1 Tax=Bacillus marinisedimentorum TaxID=1821260 RepID=UPI0007E1672E|nr:cell wall-binding repeat-containing protein [Bacillus marinisedimentorum]
MKILSRLFVSLLGIVFLFTFPVDALAEKVVVIDPGHGGKYTGTCGYTRESGKDICERDVNLGVGLKLRDELKKAGFTVYMTRDTDKHFSPYLRTADGDDTGGDFDVRMTLANSYAKENNDNSVFVSVHHNASPTSPYVKGYETYYYDGVNHYKSSWPPDPIQLGYLDFSKRLAYSIHPNVVKSTGMYDRKVHNDQSFYVIRNAQMPAVLLELGYMTNRDEERLIKSDSRQQKAAEGVTQGIINYFKVFEVQDATKKILKVFSTKEQAISYAKEQSKLVKVFDKYNQNYVYSNARYTIVHKQKGTLGEYATKENAVGVAKQTADTRIVDSENNWTVWSNYLAPKYKVTLLDENQTLNFIDYNEALGFAERHSNARITKNETNQLLWTNVSGENPQIVSKQTKIAGSSRYSTAISISKKLYPNGFADEKEHKTVILATGENPSDALSAGPLTRVYGKAPILLTKTESLYSGVKTELERLGAKEVVVIGGPAAVSDSVVNELKSFGVLVNRISGASRYHTNQEINKKLNNVNGVFVASGDSYADALAAAPIAAANNWAISLTGKDKIMDSSLSYLQGKKSIILGGTAVISNNVQQQVAGVTSAERIAGSSRFGTLAKVLWYFDGSINSNTVNVTTGWNFPDALAAAPLSMDNSAPLILVGDQLHHSLESYLLKYAEKESVTEVNTVGGVVAEQVSQSITDNVR